jgi:ABC-type multidrug transport system fused ATPase/permease subunit
VCRVLALEPAIEEPKRSWPEPAADAELVDVASGLRLTPGRLTAVVADPPEDAAAIADRLGRYDEGEVRWGDVPLDGLPRDVVRRRVVVSDTGSTLFSGTLRDAVDVHGTSEAALLAALHAASAEDILDALPDGLDAPVTERGRSFSGGQRQRLVLARVLALDPEVLVLVEPTSAVDAHTEARVADRLVESRKGRTTMVTTSSPLVLDRADRVAFVQNGRVVAIGRHRDLLREEPAYRAVVTREEEVSR